MHAFALAYALSTVSGLRVSYPLAALCLAAHAHMLHVPSNLRVLNSDSALWMTLVASVVECIAHKIPAVDGVVHVAHRLLAPLVGAVTVAAVTSSHGSTTFFPALLGAGNAFMVHTLRATARATGSVFLLGSVHPLASFAEDGFVCIALNAAFSATQAVAVVAFLLMILCWLLTYRSVPRRRRRRVRA
jgi:Domain of unknown function (DUF4126)